jgi:hypothetical protein
MNRYVPHQNSFNRAKVFDQWQGWVLWISTGLTFLSILLNKVELPASVITNKEILIDWVNITASIFAVGYVVLDILINDKFYNSGIEKRLDLVDHAFDTNFSGDKSTGYFNAEGVRVGIYKLAVLIFENSLFTSTIAKKMAVKKWWMTVFISAVFIVSAGLGNKELVNNILQIAATGVLIQQTIKLQQFANRMSAIHSNLKTLFNDLISEQDKVNKEGNMIKNILDYECTHSWGGILLSSKIFNKQNDELSKKWEGMKKTYLIS